MNLQEQSPLWLIPFGLLMLVMLHSMMEFTVSILVLRPQAGRRPIPAAELRKRLLAFNETGPAYPLAEGTDCDLEVRWEGDPPPRPGRLAIARGASGGRLRLLLDEQRREVRMNQVTRSYYFFFGLSGWLPRLAGYAGAQSGPPGLPLAAELSRIVTRAGWSVRPVIWWFQATHGGYRRLAALTPAPLRRWPARRFWGVLYPLSYVLGVSYLAVILGPLEGPDLRLLVGVSAAWWVTWGFLVWALLGFPPFWRR